MRPAAYSWQLRDAKVVVRPFVRPDWLAPVRRVEERVSASVVMAEDIPQGREEHEQATTAVSGHPITADHVAGRGVQGDACRAIALHDVPDDGVAVRLDKGDAALAVRGRDVGPHLRIGRSELNADSGVAIVVRYVAVDFGPGGAVRDDADEVVR